MQSCVPVTAASFHLTMLRPAQLVPVPFALVPLALGAFATDARAQTADVLAPVFSPQFGPAPATVIDTDGTTLVQTSLNGGPGPRVLFAIRDGDGDWIPDPKVPEFVPGGFGPGQSTQQTGLGFSIAIDGDTLALGRQTLNVNPPGPDGWNAAGGVSVYERDPSGAWVLAAEFTSPDPENDGLFGARLDLDGDRLAVSALFEDAGTEGDEGRVHVFERSGGSWNHVAALTAPAPQKSSEFGDKLDIEGDRLAIASADETTEAPFGIGVVHLYERSGAGVWSFARTFDGHDLAGVRGNFGRDVALDGERLVIGATGGGDPGSTPAGRIAVYAWSGTEWVLDGTCVPRIPYPTVFGDEVAIDGDRIATLGGLGTPIGAGGTAVIFERAPSGEWFEHSILGSSEFGEPTFTNSGDIVLAGDTVAIEKGSTTTLVGRVRPFLGGRRSVLGAAGGMQELFLRAGPAHPFEVFVLLGSVTGTSPATVPGLPFTVPLVWDAYTDALLATLGGPLDPWFGFLDAYGRADARIRIPTGSAALAGLDVHHAFVTFQVLPSVAPTFASNAVTLTID